MRKSNDKIITNGKLNIVFKDNCIEETREYAETIAKRMDEEPEYNCYYKGNRKCLGAEYISETNRLLDLLERVVTEYPDKLDIFKLIPLTKQGNFPKNQTILLADSDVSTVFKGDFFEKENLQLVLTEVAECEPVIEENEGLDEDNTRRLSVYHYRSNRKTPPVFDMNGNAQKVEKTRSKCLKNEEITPGSVYEDSKGVQYLYLGKLSTGSEHHWAHSPVYDINDVHIWVYGYCYIKYTDKLKEKLSGCNTLTELIDTLILHLTTKGKLFYDRVNLWENPRRFVSKVETLVPYEHIEDHVVAGKTYVDEDGDKSKIDTRVKEYTEDDAIDLSGPLLK